MNAIMPFSYRKKRTLVEAHTPPSPRAPGVYRLPIHGPCPEVDALTAYDRANLATYACLLEAEALGATLEEMAWVVFRIDPAKQHDWAVRVAQSHLRRAHWIDVHFCPCLDGASVA